MFVILLFLCFLLFIGTVLFIRNGSYILVDTSHSEIFGGKSLYPIKQVLHRVHIRHIQKHNLWPFEIEEKGRGALVAKQGHNRAKRNRKRFEESESSSSSSSSSSDSEDSSDSSSSDQSTSSDSDQRDESNHAPRKSQGRRQPHKGGAARRPVTKITQTKEEVSSSSDNESTEEESGSQRVHAGTQQSRTSVLGESLKTLASAIEAGVRKT